MKRWIKWRKWLLGLILLVCLSSPSVQAAGLGDDAPAFSLPSLSGKKRDLQDFRGKVILLNFWATWCVPCREELPELEKMQQQFRTKGFEVIGINLDKKPKSAEKYVQDFALSYTILHDPEAEVMQQYPGRAMPISYLIDRSGRMQKIFFGFNRKKVPEMSDAIQTLLAEGMRSKNEP